MVWALAFSVREISRFRGLGLGAQILASAQAKRKE